MEESEGLTRPPSQPEEEGDRKLKGVAFWYSTGDTRSSNTKDDIDVELISLDKFFGQVRRTREAPFVCVMSFWCHPLQRVFLSTRFFCRAKYIGKAVNYLPCVGVCVSNCHVSAPSVVSLRVCLQWHPIRSASTFLGVG